MVCILARGGHAKIPIAGPNSPYMLPRHTKEKVRLGISHTQTRPNDCDIEFVPGQ